jgi:HEAT repeat protein
MRKRSTWLIVLAILVAVTLVVLLEPTGVVRGYVRGESFFDGRPASTWVNRLRSGNPKVETEARRSLREGGAAAIPVLTEFIHWPGSWDIGEVRILGVDLLAELGHSAHTAIPTVVAALSDQDSALRSRAAEALGAIGPNDPRVIAALTAELRLNPVPAARGLAKCGAMALPATKDLVTLLQSPQSDVRWNAARTLGKIGDADAIAPLSAALSDSHELVREHAAEALGEFGPAAAAAVDRLVEALKDPHANVRRDTARALGQIGQPARKAIPILREIANDDPDEGVRQAAGGAVKRLGG